MCLKLLLIDRIHFSTPKLYRYVAGQYLSEFRCLWVSLSCHSIMKIMISFHEDCMEIFTAVTTYVHHMQAISIFFTKHGVIVVYTTG